jgi:hypothetical protein
VSKTQLRELKTLLVLIASRLPSEALDDATRVLLYRGQILADECFANRTAREPLSNTG